MSDLDPTQLAALDPRYEVIRQLGKGGMAVVLLARDRENGRQVAIKVLRPEFASTLIAVRFRREIGFLRALEHPNILPVLDVPAEGDALYFVMPYVSDETLRTLLEREGRLTLDRVRRIVADLASALDYAHAADVLHRDLKPENVLLSGDRALLCDFGVARAVRRAATEDRISASGVTVGTPMYMSPEQAFERDGVDGRTDVYALGCLTYEMLTGTPPYTGATTVEIISRHLRESPPSLRRVLPRIGAGVDATVQSALAKKSEERPRTAGRFAELLNRDDV